MILTNWLYSLQTGSFTIKRNVFSIPAGRSMFIQHWQLRDFVQSTPYRPNSVLYVNITVCREVDLATGRITRAMPSWDFAPKCVGILGDYVLVGSDGGWIQGQSLNKTKDENMKYQLSTQINNNVCLYVALDGTRRALIG